MAQELLREMANQASQSILSLLALEPSYPRRIGALLGLSETEVARRLRRLEKLGLVEGKWGRKEHNVKIYRLASDTVQLRVTKTGLDVWVGPGTGPGAPGARAGNASPVGSTAAATRGASGGTPAANSAANARGSLLQDPQLPSDDGFVGRAAELTAIAGPEPVVLVLGMPGIGKTSLLARFARTRPEGQRVFWRALRGIESLPWLANQVALFLAQQGDGALLEVLDGAAGHDSDVLPHLLRAIDRPGTTFILDEAHRAEDPAVRAFLAEAVAQVRQGKLVIASREWIVHNPARPGLRVLHLAGLGDADAAAVLKSRGVPVAPSLGPRLRDEVGGHPLGLHLLAQAAQEANGLEALLDRVPEQGLEAWLLQELQDHLSEDEATALAHGSLLRTAFTAADVAAVSKRRLDQALTRLRRRMLLTESRGAFQMHEVVQNFYYSRLEDKKTLHQRAAQHYLAKGTLEGRLEAMHHFLAAGDRKRVLELLEHNLDLREFDFVDAGYQRLYLGVLQMFRRSEVASDRHWGLIQDEKADILLHQGDAAQALPLHQEALAMFRSGDDDERCADSSWKVALALHALGRTDEARDTCHAALLAAPEGLSKTRLQELLAELRGVPVAQAVADITAKPARRTKPDPGDQAAPAARQPPRRKPARP